MNKVKIEIERDENFPSGYGRMSLLEENSPFVLDKLIEWSKTNNRFKIYRHKVGYVEEGAGTLGKYNFGKGWINHDKNDGADKCHFVCYLTIYYQKSERKNPELILGIMV
jgi:hypothetical protein